MNPAAGDCAFEAVINNINYRNCYNEKLNDTTNNYRLEWITKLKNEQKQIGCIYTDKDRTTEWEQLKRPGTYTTEISDLALVAIARGCHKDILIFNTSVEAHGPIYVIRAGEYTGGIRNEITPVTVAYNGYHYESIEPITETDRLRSISLVENYKNGDYTMEQNDIRRLTELIYTTDNPNPNHERGQGAGQRKDKFNVKGKPNNRANMEKRKEYSCNKCKITYSTHKDWVYHNRLEHLKTKCTKCETKIYGERNNKSRRMYRRNKKRNHPSNSSIQWVSLRIHRTNNRK